MGLEFNILDLFEWVHKRWIDMIELMAAHCIAAKWGC